MDKTAKLGLGVVLLALSLASVLAFMETRKPRERRSCGHPKLFQDSVPKWFPIPRATHCCRSGRLVNDLKNIALAQFIFRSDHGRFALCVDELNTEFTVPLRISAPIEFESDGTNWSVVVPRTKRLAGNYLLDSSGAIFFHENRTPTTNDLKLSKLSGH